MSAVLEHEAVVRFASMGSDVVLRVVRPGPGAAAALDRAAAAVQDVARHLTRFERSSALCRVNRDPDAWHRVPVVLAQALAEAERAHLATGGIFDPRVLPALVDWGYDRTFAELATAVPADADAHRTPRPPAHPLRGRWQPVVLPGAGEPLVSLGGEPVDLGGIGKGLAVRAAAAELAGSGAAVLVDAGGDEWLGGAGPSGDGWRVGVEDPAGGDDPLLVLRLVDSGCATSSVRRRTWRTAAGAVVHHLVDPRTGLPGGDGLAQVTVVHPDPAWAEVWSKTLFLAGADGVAALAGAHGLAAVWVTRDGHVTTSAAIAPHVLWRADR